MQQPQRAGIYCRKSTDDGLDSQVITSLDAQRTFCERFAQSNGWSVHPTCYDDGGYSGKTLERPAVKCLMEDIERGLLDVVVVYRFDRLTRDTGDFAQFTRFCQEHGITLASASENMDLNTSSGRLTANITAAVSQHERESIVQRISDKLQLMKEEGLRTGGAPVLGFDIDNETRQFVVNEEEARIVRSMFQRFTELRSITKLMDELNAQGITSKVWKTEKGKLKGGGSWTKQKLYRHLKHRAYIGELEYKDKVYKAVHEPIVSREIWERAQKLIVSMPRKKKRKGTRAMLEGLLRCGYCGTALSPNYAKKGNIRHNYYRCTNSMRRSRAACPLAILPADEMDATAWAYLLGVFRDAEEYLPGLPLIQDIDVRRKLRSFIELSNALYPEVKARIIMAIIKEIVVFKELIKVTVSLDGLVAVGMGQEYDAQQTPMDKLLVETFSVKVTCTSGRRRIKSKGMRICPTPTLKAVANAHYWMRLIESGKYSSVSELAKALGKDRTYVARILKLVSLAPDIVEAIIQGDVPDNASIANLTKLSHIWAEQHATL